MINYTIEYVDGAGRRLGRGSLIRRAKVTDWPDLISMWPAHTETVLIREGVQETKLVCAYRVQGEDLVMASSV